MRDYSVVVDSGIAYNLNIHTSHLDILFCGTQKCEPMHFYGPYTRPYFLMVFAHSGKGIFRTQSKTYHLEAGSTFFIFPGEVTYYEADSDDPWEYSWIAFSCRVGLYSMEQLLLRSSISSHRPVHITKDYAELDRLYREVFVFSRSEKPFADIKIMSLFWDIVYQYTISANITSSSLLISPTSAHVSIAIEYIKCYYHKSISVAMVAEHVGISREHLCNLFKKQYGISPVQFISLYRIQQSEMLLLTTDYSIDTISGMVGFSDYNYFSNKFTGINKISPTKFRKNGRHVY